MRRPTLLTRTLIATLVSWLAAGPVAARPLVLPDQVSTAASGPRLIVVVIPLDAVAKPLQGALEQQAEASARAASRFEVVPLTDALEPTAARERTARLETARLKMTDGQKALDDLDTPRGVEAFGEAVKLLKETNTAVTFDDLVKAWVMKAGSHALGGELAPAKQEIERVVAIQPRAEFAPQFFPPELIKFVEQQRKLANNAKGELVVRTEPPGATVWVNGQVQGQSPVSVKGLLGARHQVVAALGGHALAVAELPPGDALIELKPTESDATWKKALDAIVKSPRAAPRDQALVTLGKKLGVDEVLAVLVKKSAAGEQLELIALRLETKDGHNAGYATATLPIASAAEALGKALEPVLATDAPRVDKKPVTHFDGGGGGGSSGKKIVGIALLGVAAGLVTTGVITAAVGQGRLDQYRATPQVQTRILEQLQGEGVAYGAVSLGSFIAGAAATGVGIGLLATSGGSTDPEPEPEPKKPSKKKKDPPPPTKGKSEPKKEEPKPEPVKEEPKKEEPPPKKEEPKKEDPPPKKEEPAKVDPKEEKRRKDEEAKLKSEEEARLKKEADARAKEEAEAKKKAEADEKRRLEDEKRQAEADKKNKKAADDAARKDEEERRRKEEEDKKRREEEEKKRREEEEKRRLEEEKKKKDQPKKEEDHDDLRNF
ncbi:MAG: PEGA domain-containing protein [Myxococcaceae bacterium]|nr:PEGA domain-containing protein [Myxococcaceae bacterium]